MHHLYIIFYNRRFSPICEFSFLQISRKLKVLELRVVLSANINMHLPVILSYVLAFHDIQKLRYSYAHICADARNFGRDFRIPEQDSDYGTNFFWFYTIELTYNHWETPCTSKCTQSIWAPRGTKSTLFCTIADFRQYANLVFFKFLEK